MKDSTPITPLDESDSRPTRHLSRRGVITAAAWSVPVIALSSALPAAAASGGLTSTRNTGPDDKVMAKSSTITGLTFQELDATGHPIATNGPITVTSTGTATGHITVPGTITLVNGVATFDVTADSTCVPGDHVTFTWTCSHGGTPSTVSFTVTIGDDSNPGGATPGNGTTADTVVTLGQFDGPIVINGLKTTSGLLYNGPLTFFYWGGTGISYSLANDQWGTGQVSNTSKTVQIVNGHGEIYVRFNQDSYGTQFAWGDGFYALKVWNGKTLY